MAGLETELRQIETHIAARGGWGRGTGNCHDIFNGSRGRAHIQVAHIYMRLIETNMMQQWSSCGMWKCSPRFSRALLLTARNTKSLSEDPRNQQQGLRLIFKPLCQASRRWNPPKTILVFSPLRKSDKADIILPWAVFHVLQFVPGRLSILPAGRRVCLLDFSLLLQGNPLASPSRIGM